MFSCVSVGQIFPPKEQRFSASAELVELGSALDFHCSPNQ
jgi:hypothetical protein